MLTLDVIILPRPSAASVELRTLGTALSRWVEEAQTERFQVLIANTGLDDLCAGELPQPFALQAALQPLELTEESRRRVQRLGVDPEDAMGVASVRAPLEYERPAPPAGELGRQFRKLGPSARARYAHFRVVGDEFTKAEIMSQLREFLGDGTGTASVLIKKAVPGTP